jgi:uncharacterized protein
VSDGPVRTSPEPSITREGDEPRAWSLDGVTFRYRSPIGAPVRLGGYVLITVHGGERLGQVLSKGAADTGGHRAVQGHGRLIGTDAGLPFDDSPVTPAPPDRIRAVVGSAAARLDLGTLVVDGDVPAVLHAKGFNRHTFLCGQSGSGKTYALGVLLENLLLRTRLPLLILDPNGDHVHLGLPRDDVAPATAAAYAAAADGVRVLHADAETEGAPLRIRLNELDAAGSAALLQLDPIADREEYNALLHILSSAAHKPFASVDEALEAFRASGDHVLELIRKRVENLRVDRMTAWAGDQARSLMEVWAEDQPRALVADTSGFEEHRERMAVAVAVLQQLWARRRLRQPLLLVVDEAHDVCPAQPGDPLQRLATELFTRIAGEGRKYGIHLLLASQRPDKLPDNVLTQCDNLMLMRVNSAADRAALATRFGFVPSTLIEMAGTFRLGESLVAGRIAPEPLLVRTGRRLTPEGGADVPTDWAVG